MSDDTRESRRDAAERRRLIEDILETSDAEVADLLTVLAGAGFEVDEDTLMDDLAALGFEVIDEPADAPVTLGSSDDVTVVAPIPAPSTDEPVLAEARAEELRPEADRSGSAGVGRGPSFVRGWPTPVLVVASIALVVLLISAALVVQSFLDRNDGDAADVMGPEVPTGVAAATPSTVSAEEFGPNHDPLLSEPDVALFFEEPTPDLPPPFPEVGWDVVGGDFGVGNGVALTSQPAENVPVIGTFPISDPNARVQVTLPQATPGAGIAIRGQDDAHLVWVLAPGFETVNLYSVTPSGVEVLVSPGPIPISPGMRLGVNMAGSNLELLAHGTVVATYERVDVTSAVGLVAMTPDQPGVFDELLLQFA